MPETASSRRTFQPSVRTATGWTILLLLVLRLAVGWHLLYEGVWKLQQDDWRATEYLLGSTGPLRGVFVGMVPQADALDRLTTEAVKSRIDKRFRALVRQYRIEGEALKDTKAYKEQMKTGGPDVEEDQKYVDAIFADRDFQEQLADYELLLSEVTARESDPATGDYSNERLVDMYKIQGTARNRLLARTEAPLDQMHRYTLSRLNAEQVAQGPPPRDLSPTLLIDLANMWGLTLIGLSLILGLFTRSAALSGAVLLSMYYLSQPPWPGLPGSSMSGGHYLIINKNLIEIIVLLMIASSRVGRWAGLDAYIGPLLRLRLKPAGTTTSAEPADTAATP